MEKRFSFSELHGGADETRTRDLLRDSCQRTLCCELHRGSATDCDTVLLPAIYAASGAIDLVEFDALQPCQTAMVCDAS